MNSSYLSENLCAYRCIDEKSDNCSANKNFQKLGMIILNFYCKSLLLKGPSLVLEYKKGHIVTMLKA